MIRRTRLYILSGLSFAGKSTLARELVRLRGWVSISMDSINDERGLGLDGARIIPAEWEETYREMYHRLRDALIQGDTVVLDAPNFSRRDRREVEQIATKCGTTSRIIYAKLDETVARMRWQNNRRKAGRHDVPDIDFEYGVTNFEPPDESENPLVFDSSTNPAEWIRSTFYE